MSEEVAKPKMTPAERMAKARAVRDANKAKRAVVHAAEIRKEEQEYAKIADGLRDHDAKHRSNDDENPSWMQPRLTDKPAQAAARTQVERDPRSSGRVQALGRNGEVLTRSSLQVGDELEIPKSMWPAGGDYQWITLDVHGNKDIVDDHNHSHYMNGWRSVPAERYAGSLLPKDAKGPFVKKRMMLMERPLVLSEDARAEEIRKAKQQITDQNQALLLARQKTVAPGFEMSDRVSGIKMQIDKSLDVVDVNRAAGKYRTADE